VTKAKRLRSNLMDKDGTPNLWRSERNGLPAWAITCQSVLLPSWVGAQELEGREVAEVRIEGNQNVPAESILLVMDTKSGRPFSAERLRQDLQAIYDMGFFAKAPVVLPMLTPEGRIIVIVRVFETPSSKPSSLRATPLSRRRSCKP